MTTIAFPLASSWHSEPTKFNISQAALSALLQIVRNADVEVPKDVDTVTCTPKAVDIVSVAGARISTLTLAPQFVHI